MVKLSCSSCGAKLELTDEIDRFACAHCGSEFLVRRGGGIVSLKPVEEQLRRLEETGREIAENTREIAGELKQKREEAEEERRSKSRGEALASVSSCLGWLFVISVSIFLAVLNSGGIFAHPWLSAISVFLFIVFVFIVVGIFSPADGSSNNTRSNS